MSKPKAKPKRRPPASPALFAGRGTRARVTQDTPLQAFGQILQLFRDDNTIELWRGVNADDNPFANFDAETLLEVLCRIAPDVANGRHFFLRAMNPGWEVHCYRPGSEETEDTRARAWVDGFLKGTLAELYGSPDIPINKLATNMLLRGGAAAELVLDRAGRVPVDLVVPDAKTIEFRTKSDPVRGTVWIPVQIQAGKPEPVSLDIPTFCYVPVDPLPGKPKGVAILEPALFVQVFLIQVLYDLKRVIMQQGYPRMDISLDLVALNENMPPEIKNDDARIVAWLDERIAGISTTLKALKPDETWVHTSDTVLNKPTGAVDSSSLGGVESILALLERMTASAMKSMPFLLGMNEATTEELATRQWEVFVAGIKAFQHVIESLLERLLGVGLRVQGIQARVEFRFAELRASELLRDAQVMALDLANARQGYEAGFLSQDEAATLAVKKEKADAPEPRAGVGTAPPEIPTNPQDTPLDSADGRALVTANGHGRE